MDNIFAVFEAVGRAVLLKGSNYYYHWQLDDAAIETLIVIHACIQAGSYQYLNIYVL